jgi:hypothetical protein
VIAQIPGIEEIWMLNLMNMKFYYLPEILLEEWQRFVVSIRVPPNKFEDTYYRLAKIIPSSEAAPVYIAYTFHMYGDSITFSLVAKDHEAANKFVEENVNNLPGIHVTNLTGIEKQMRLTSPESWKLYVKSNLLSKETFKTQNESIFSINKTQQMANI